MGETVTLSLLLLARKALMVALEKGFAVSVAFTHRDTKPEYRYKVSDWDDRCKSCLGDKDEEDKGKG